MPLPVRAAAQDFEILMSGCVVIKPRADIFKIHPPIFEASPSFPGSGVAATSSATPYHNARTCAPSSALPPSLLTPSACAKQPNLTAAFLPPPACLPALQHNVTAISTREDLTDLEEQILPFLQDLPRAQVGPGCARACA